MVVTTRVRLDRIASSTRNAALTTEVILGDEIVAAEGYVLAVRILTDKSSYNTVEDLGGRMVSLRSGDILAGTLGVRRALRGYAGEVPKTIAVGDTIEVLNLGGILGRCTSANPDIGPPFQAEVLGAVLSFPELGDRIGRPAHIRDRAVPPAETLSCDIPVIYVAGTCMNAGKTAAACALVRHFTQAGLKVGGAKLTGVSLQRDILGMKDYGADVAFDFTDAGVVCTHAENALASARTLLAHVAESGADVIVAETGDGIMGDYGVQAILADPELRGLAAAFLLCANDPVGASGGVRELSEKYGIQVDVVTGPATDNRVGVRFVERELKLPAINARNDAKALGAHVLEKVQARMVKA